MRPKMRASGCFLRFGILVLAVHLLAASGLAQEPDAQSPTTPDGVANSKTDGNSYSLSGTVINAITGEPVRRAAIQISGQNGSLTLTDAGGHFVVEGLAEGNVLLRAMKPGFYDDEGSHPSSAQVGKDAPAVVLKLTPWAVISGRVTTKDEQPLLLELPEKPESTGESKTKAEAKSISLYVPLLPPRWAIAHSTAP